MKDKDKIIKDVIGKKGLVSTSHLKDAVEKQQLSGRPLDEIMVELGYITEEKMTMALSEEVGVPYVDLVNYEIEKDIIKLFPEPMIRELNVVPLFKLENSLTVAMEDPLDIRVVDKLRYRSKLEIDPMFATKTAIKHILEKIYGQKDVSGSLVDNIKMERGKPSSMREDTAAGIAAAKYESRVLKRDARGKIKGGPIEALSAAEKKAVINLVDNIMRQAVNNKASDIHLEPEDQNVYLRFRIDGILYDVPPPPKELEAAIISRIKILSNMDIAEKRLPQDGRIQMMIDNNEVDLRVSTFPTIYGENISIRVLDKSSILKNLTELGLTQEMLKSMREVMTKPYGIILATGPTGCGKTTTLYAVLRELNKVDKNIITLEDPVEYRVERIRQSQIDPKAGLTFAAGLRSMVRQDPDVIFIGEIRDLETAEIAIRSALTGHLVLSTLHTNDAPSAVSRLVDMGIERFLVSSSVVGVIAQRLVRVLCKKCRKSYKPQKELLQSLGLPANKDYKFYKTGGCDNCRDTGYSGRTAVFELMVMSEALKNLLMKDPSSIRIKEEAIKEKMITLRTDGIKKVLTGITTVEEIMRTTDKDALGEDSA